MDGRKTWCHVLEYLYEAYHPPLPQAMSLRTEEYYSVRCQTNVFLTNQPLLQKLKILLQSGYFDSRKIKDVR
jgi:hypothetical protein